MTDFTEPRTQLKQHMRILRKKFGASSKVGRRASNVMETIDNNPDAIEPTAEFQFFDPETSIKRQLTDITLLVAQSSQQPLHQR